MRSRYIIHNMYNTITEKTNPDLNFAFLPVVRWCWDTWLLARYPPHPLPVLGEIKRVPSCGKQLTRETVLLCLTQITRVALVARQTRIPRASRMKGKPHRPTINHKRERDVTTNRRLSVAVLSTTCTFAEEGRRFPPAGRDPAMDIQHRDLLCRRLCLVVNQAEAALRSSVSCTSCCRNIPVGGARGPGVNN